jgi:hypothetical protein
MAERILGSLPQDRKDKCFKDRKCAVESENIDPNIMRNFPLKLKVF